MGKTGILLLGFGGPDSLEAIGPFMTNLMGREPSEELFERVTRRYLAIGGVSPLPQIAASIATTLQGALAEEGHHVPVAVGMRYWRPFIPDALAALKELGCDRVVTVSLSPFETKVAQQEYRDVLTAAAADLGGFEIVEAPLLSKIPAFAEYLAGGCATALTDIQPNEDALIAFTAHSLPVSDLAEDESYVAGLQSVAEAVAEILGLNPGHPGAGPAILGDFRAYGDDQRPRGWFLVYQSKGNKPGEWLGPFIEDLIDAAAEHHASGLVVCPIGFATDHMETMYDLDIVAADRAFEAGLEFLRSPLPNDDPTFVDALASEVAKLI